MKKKTKQITFEDFLKKIKEISDEKKYKQLSLFDEQNNVQRDMQPLRTQKK